MKDYWYDKIEVSVFLCGPLSDSASCTGVVTDAQRLEIQRDLDALPVVETVYYESQSEAFDRFQERFKDSAIAQNVTVDQLPESFRVKLKDPTQFAVIQSAFSGRPGVDVVQDQRTILEKSFRLLNVLRDGALAIGFASVLTAALLISNTLRIAAFNRRRETNVMKLVGASWTMASTSDQIDRSVAYNQGAQHYDIHDFRFDEKSRRHQGDQNGGQYQCLRIDQPCVQSWFGEIEGQLKRQVS